MTQTAKDFIPVVAWVSMFVMAALFASDFNTDANKSLTQRSGLHASHNFPVNR